jgi:aspartyl-tRNA(Asn)/glutamyl-tRNA(Gln) amidotransferase subunit B
LEIVTNPVIETPEEARTFLKKLRSIITHCEVSDLSLEGAMRVDANISIRGHPRTELKNISSFKDVEKALRWEILRQKRELKKGNEIIQETRHFNGRTTYSLRQKESESEYRYFPEADLVPIEISEEMIGQVESNMPELPDSRIKRVQKQYSLNDYDAEVIVSEKAIADFFEESCKLGKNYQAIKNWLLNDILGLMNEKGVYIQNLKIKPKNLVNMVAKIEEGDITVKIAKKYIEALLGGITLKQWLKKHGIKKISDHNILSDIADRIIAENAGVVKDLNKNPRSFEFFVGQMMKETKGQADIELTRVLFKEKLKDKM